MSDEKKEEKPKLNFKKKAQGEDGEDGIYRYGDVTITVTRETVGVPDGFFKRTHKPSRTVDFSGAFSNDDEKIGNGAIPISDVQKATFYYWKKEKTNPLILEVTKSSDGKLQYYYRYSKDEKPGNTTTWTYDNNENTLLIERLDDRNCGVNKAIVYDLKGTYSTSTSETSTEGSGGANSNCRNKTRKITVNTPASITEPLGGNYTVKEYDVTPGTRISRVIYGKEGDTETSTEGITPPNEAVTKIRVYYWKYGITEKDIPLLVEFVKSENGSDWFENTSQESITWNPVTNTTDFYNNTGQPKQELTTKLDEVNCNVNGVVQIHLSEPKVGDQSTYCHTPTGQDPGHNIKRISVSLVDDSTESLVNYKAYEHKPNNTSKKFHISSFKNGMNEIKLNGLDLPVMDASKVIVYLCIKDTTKTPLLIYIEAPTLNTPNRKWYKNKGLTWNKVDQAPSTPESCSQILDILDKLTSDCKPPEVTIKINERDPTGRSFTYKDISLPDKNVNVEKNEPSNAPGFTEYTHTVQDRTYFTLKQVNYGDTSQISKIKRTPKVSSVSVFYWTALETNTWKEKSNPLLIRIEKHGSSDPEWYENQSIDKNNNNWHNISKPYKGALSQSDKLQKKLESVNCYVNNVTVIDIGKKPQPKDTPITYCHDNDRDVEESHEPNLIQVKDIIGEKPYKDKLGSFVVYQHIVNPSVSEQRSFGDKFHISGFKNNENTVEIKDDSLVPVLNVTKFLVFWCSDTDKGRPLLFYVKYNKDPSGGESTEEWFKRKDKDSSEWIKLTEGNGRPQSVDTLADIYTIINGFDTPCKNNALLYVLTGTASGGATGGAGYGIYKVIEWFFMAPWPRLM